MTIHMTDSSNTVNLHLRVASHINKAKVTKLQIIKYVLVLADASQLRNQASDCGCFEGPDKKHWMSWDKVSHPIDHNGLGISSVHHLSTTFAGKLWCLVADALASFKLLLQIHM
ncbi:hypothetical protein M9H77_18036 [Catharanthus roseus]|uniref:Uncharacterized protein n=1 Tax=Catharanthus roseus TaxID=4058 RepID=A0ACC0B6M8_CATRO|nr:hypothetical protein M9H77_18036 [Catharanthus roseus]